MKSAGKVTDVNHRGELILRGAEARKPGTVVFDSRKQRVGSVIRTFGPVESPYLLVKVTGIPDSEKMRLMNSELYYEKDGRDGMQRKRVSKHGKKKRRPRRDNGVSGV